MDVGQTVYRGVVRNGIRDNAEYPYYMDEATATSIELDGTPLVRFVNLLMPGTGWHATETAAKQAVVDELVRHIGALQAAADRLRDEILHDHLTTEEAAA